MKIVIAPDSFKNALRSHEVALALAEGWRSRRPDDEIVTIPLSDGGEGLTEAVVRATGGTFRTFELHDFGANRNRDGAGASHPAHGSCFH